MVEKGGGMIKDLNISKKTLCGILTLLFGIAADIVLNHPELVSIFMHTLFVMITTITLITIVPIAIGYIKPQQARIIKYSIITLTAFMFLIFISYFLAHFPFTALGYVFG